MIFHILGKASLLHGELQCISLKQFSTTHWGGQTHIHILGESFLSLMAPFYSKEKEMKLGERGIDVKGRKKLEK